MFLNLEIENSLKIGHWKFKTNFMQQKNEPQQNNNLLKRPPIVVVMGHVDHGKTSILDYIRKSKVAEKESGGITQHIGAYEIEITTKDSEQRKITFIDTPGHEAFTKMRGRGAKVADIAILVIAADEGFKPQTKEAFRIIKEEKIPFIVATSKIDKPNANIEIIKKECGDNEIYIEEWGGETPFIPVSSKTGAGMEELLETIILLSDISNFSGDAALPAEGIVIESHLDKRRGNTATLIIKNGALKKGDYIVSKDSIATVKILENFLRQTIDYAIFSSPVLIAGFNKIPPIGSTFKSFKTKIDAENYLSASKKKDTQTKDLPAKPNEENNVLIIPIILKTDTAGSLEAIHEELLKLRNENVKIDILSEKTGDINENDVKLASINENSLIIGFNVSADKTVKNVLERFSVKYNSFSIIYKLTEWLREEIESRAPVETKEDMVGKIEILKVFKKDLPKEILGGRVLNGKIIKGGYLKPQVKFKEITPPQTTGKITELEKNKTKTDEVKEGNEFGIMAEVKKEIKEGDILEVYEKQTLKKKIY